MVLPAEQRCTFPLQRRDNGLRANGAAVKRTSVASHRPLRIPLGALHELLPNRFGQQPLGAPSQNGNVDARCTRYGDRSAPSVRRRALDIGPLPPGSTQTAQRGSRECKESNDLLTTHEYTELNDQALAQPRCIPPPERNGLLPCPACASALR